jgi:hypothetical protein
MGEVYVIVDCINRYIFVRFGGVLTDTGRDRIFGSPCCPGNLLYGYNIGGMVG